jgi:hypothetical protein
MPLRGYARKRTHKEPNSKLSETQVSFLCAFCDSHEDTQSQLRAKTVRDAMVAKFGDLKLDENSEPIVMKETPIFNWLKTRWAAKKLALSNLAAMLVVQEKNKEQGNAAAMADEDDGDGEG